MAGHFKLLPVVLLLPLFTFSVYGDLIASIDCGASDITTDSNLIIWSSDDSLASNGVARVVQTGYSVSTVMDSLTVFTSRKKNCYSVAVTKGDKVLVRASFNYGNYDRLLSPPTFDLHFDGNFWTTVRPSSTGLTVHEAIYIAKHDDVSVCLAQTNPGQFPFISALEVRSVDSEAYSLVDDNRALFLINRFAYGATENIRYPSDLYDRIWLAGVDGNETLRVTNDAIFTNTTVSNNPPSELFQNAITIDSTTSSMILGTVPPSNTPVYVIMYFTEVTNLDSTQTRSFRVYQSSDRSALSPAITPPFGGVYEFSLSNYTVGSNTDIFLLATADSDLPPLISALEAFNISGVLTDGTDSNDVEVLALLQTTYDVLGEWSGDPCLPAPYSWDWLNCSNDATPRITALYLDSFDLSDSLPDISAMDALEIIDLHNNSLTGEIPSFLGSLPNLRQLNLADNEFSGAIPSSLSKNKKLKLTVTGNPSLCSSGKPCSTPPPIDPDSNTAKSKKKSSLPIVLGVAIPAFFLIWVAAGVFIILRRRSRTSDPVKPVVKGGGAYGNNGGGANGISNGLQRMGEEMVNDNMENGVQHTFGSPSPLLETTDQTSDSYGQTEPRSP